MRKWILVAIVTFQFACESKKEWTFKEKIPLDGISPLGIVQDNETLIISDPDNNRIIITDLKGKPIEEWNNIQRPMHIDLNGGKIFSTEFINDRVVTIQNGKIEPFNLDIEFDAPAAIDVDGERMAIADFYNHLVHVITNGQVLQIGGEGHDDGKLY